MDHPTPSIVAMDVNDSGAGQRPYETMTHPLEAAIARYNDAWNRHDVDAILAMHTEDSVFENHTSGGKGTGKAEIRPIIESVFATFPDLHFEGRRLYVRDDLVVQEWTATATHAKPITRAGRTYPPSGKKICWNGMDVIPMRGGLVARKDVYADSIAYLRQIGVPVP
jgi:steroid delta-isomerase-like uncharacterized protein